MPYLAILDDVNGELDDIILTSTSSVSGQEKFSSSPTKLFNTLFNHFTRSFNILLTFYKTDLS